MSHVGITATRAGLTDEQMLFLNSWLALTDTVHHGDCIGGDADADKVLKHLGIKRIAHPSNIPEQRAYCKCEVILEPKDPIERNHDIVDICQILIAFPKSEVEERRSGTWATVRYARMMNRTIRIVYPDGHFVTERTLAKPRSKR